jgi:hypothetical protein
LAPSQKQYNNRSLRPRRQTDQEKEAITIAKNTTLSMGTKLSIRMVAHRNKLAEAGAEDEVTI